MVRKMRRKAGVKRPESAIRKHRARHRVKDGTVPICNKAAGTRRDPLRGCGGIGQQRRH
mgnify:CR=1 FL=1